MNRVARPAVSEPPLARRRMMRGMIQRFDVPMLRGRLALGGRHPSKRVGNHPDRVWVALGVPDADGVQVPRVSVKQPLGFSTVQSAQSPNLCIGCGSGSWRAVAQGFGS